MKKKHFFVTGGTGFIGSNISKMLIETGHRVTIYDNNARGSLEKISSIISKVKFIKGDIRDQKKVLESMANKKIDTVIHLAYVNGTKFFYSKPELILEIAVKGLFNVIDGCMKNNIKEFYLASSSEVYQTPLKIPTDENEMLKIPDIMNPRYSYGGGKIISELLCINYGKKFFKKMIIFRPHNVYGKNMGNEHVIPEFINRFRNFKGKFFNIQGSGEETRSFIYISDFIKAFELILKKGKHLNIYNIGTSEEIKIKNLALMISNFLNLKIKIRKTSLQPGSSLRRCPKISKIKKLGFKQKIKILDGLQKTIF